VAVRRGDELDLGEEHAAAMIARGWAEAVAPDVPAPPVEPEVAIAPAATEEPAETAAEPETATTRRRRT